MTLSTDGNPTKEKRKVLDITEKVLDHPIKSASSQHAAWVPEPNEMLWAHVAGRTGAVVTVMARFEKLNTAGQAVVELYPQFKLPVAFLVDVALEHVSPLD